MGAYVEVPLDIAQRRQIGGEGLSLGEMSKLAEELQLTGFVSGAEFLQEQSSEQ